MGIYAADIEIWKDVIGWESRYQVSTHGRVMSKSYVKHTRNASGDFSYVTKPKLMKLSVNAHGYPAVDLRFNRSRCVVVVHRLVAAAFLKNPEDLPIVNHKDSNKENNCVNNLEWCTQQHNVQHSYDSGSNSNAGDLHPRKVLSEALVREMRTLWKSGVSRLELVEIYGFKYCTIDKAVRGINWGHVK